MAYARTSQDEGLLGGNGEVVNLRELLVALRRSWWLPLLGLVVGAGVGLGASLAATPVYTSQTQLFVSTTDSTSTSAVFQGSQFSEQRVTSYAQLLTGDELATRVVNRLGEQMTPQELASEVTASAVPNTVLLDVSVTDPSPQTARDIARAIGVEFPRMVADLEATDASGASPVKVTVTQDAQVPSGPSAPKKSRNTALGGVAGLLVGVVLALLRMRLDRSIRNSDEVAGLAGAPVIGTVLRDAKLEKQHTMDRASSVRTAEDFRQLRTNLQFVNVDDPPKIIMVSSALPSEGKTTLVVNLALALAEAGQRVTVVEADLRRPKVTRYLGIVSGVGLTNVLAGTAEVEEVAQTYREGMSVIAAGPIPPNPGELLASSHMAGILNKLRGQSDFVLLDAPPLLPVADSSGLAAGTDGVLLSVRYGKTHKEQLRQAAVTLERVGARTLGVVLNIVPPKAETAAGYGYGYAYDSDGGGSHRRDQ